MSSEIRKNTDQEVRQDISLKQIINGIRKEFKAQMAKWPIFLVAILLGGVLGITYAIMKKTFYTASTTFVLESGSSGSMAQYAGIASMVGLNLGGADNGIFQGDNLFELYKSRKMLQRALLTEVKINGKSQKLIDRYREISRPDGQKPDSTEVRFDLDEGQQLTRVQDSLISMVVQDINRNYINVSKPDKKLSIIRVDVKATDEEFAKVFNDQLVATVNDFYIQTKTKRSLSNLASLQYQTDSVRAVLNNSIYNSAVVADRTPNLNPTRQVLRSSAQQYQVNAEANKAILSQLIQNLELSKLTLRNETPLIQIIDSPVYPLAKDKLGKAKAAIFGGFFAAFFCAIFLFAARKIRSLEVE